MTAWPRLHAGMAAGALLLVLGAPALAAERYALVVSGASAGAPYAQKYDKWRADLVTTLREKYLGLYAQDNMKLSKKLKVHLHVSSAPSLTELDVTERPVGRGVEVSHQRRRGPLHGVDERGVDVVLRNLPLEDGRIGDQRPE